MTKSPMPCRLSEWELTFVHESKGLSGSEWQVLISGHHVQLHKDMGSIKITHLLEALQRCVQALLALLPHVLQKMLILLVSVQLDLHDSDSPGSLPGVQQ